MHIPKLLPRSVERLSRFSPAQEKKAPVQDRVCCCAPTRHPGSFRCRLHRSDATIRAVFPETNRSVEGKPTRVRAPSPPPPGWQSQSEWSAPLARKPTRPAAVSGQRSMSVESEGWPFRFLKSAASGIKERMSYSDFQSTNKPPKGGRYYEVQKGDTLSSIAKKMGTLVEVLLEANGRESDVIYPGEQLWVPNTHTIQKGETLSKIARDNGISVGDILQNNSVENPDLIYPGDILLLP
eukprot:TRINITY_DN30364_c0_g1_i1.p1 TRINITY_DN30364_c0_g1~~TRINITY_DN30364_c0_g1_i1.p1  ORF type:complete len:238 (+),score=19.74 TRINITY_DN30364_c0_g1_i1:160-873(+)